MFVHTSWISTELYTEGPNSTLVCSSSTMFVASRSKPTPFPNTPDTNVPLLVVLLRSVSGMGLGRTVLALEADVLVDDQVAGARVDGGANGEGNDDTCTLHEHISQHIEPDWVPAAYRGESTRGGSA